MNTSKTKSQADDLENRDPARPEDDTATRGAVAPGNETAELKAKIESLEDSLLRAKADFQNLQRRAAAERAEAIRYANADLMRSFLNVLDDFDRSLEAAGVADNKDAVIDGVRLVHGNLMKALKDAGLEQIDALGQPFDPKIHEALMQQPTDDFPPDTVVDQAARGYRLRDRVLRPARVIVSKPRQ